jgi:hypothetical protein
MLAKSVGGCNMFVSPPLGSSRMYRKVCPSLTNNHERFVYLSGSADRLSGCKTFGYAFRTRGHGLTPRTRREYDTQTHLLMAMQSCATAGYSCAYSDAAGIFVDAYFTRQIGVKPEGGYPVHYWSYCRKCV